MPNIKGEHIRSVIMKNLFVWIVLISTAALGVAVAQPNGDDYAAYVSIAYVTSQESRRV